MKPQNYPDIVKGLFVFLQYFAGLVLVATVSIYFLFHTIRYENILLNGRSIDIKKNADIHDKLSALTKSLVEDFRSYRGVQNTSNNAATVEKIINSIKQNKHRLSMDFLSKDTLNRLIIYKKIDTVTAEMLISEDSLIKQRRKNSGRG